MFKEDIHPIESINLTPLETKSQSIQSNQSNQVNQSIQQNQMNQSIQTTQMNQMNQHQPVKTVEKKRINPIVIDKLPEEQQKEPPQTVNRPSQQLPMIYDNKTSIIKTEAIKLQPMKSVNPLFDFNETHDVPQPKTETFSSFTAFNHPTITIAQPQIHPIIDAEVINLDDDE